VSQRDAPCEIIFYAGGLQMERTMKLRLVFTTLGPLTLGLLFAAYSPSAHADTVTVFGTPGFDGGHGGNPTRFSPRHFRARHFVLLRYKNANGRTRRLGDYTAWGA
jgi:hypothetical protein